MNSDCNGSTSSQLTKTTVSRSNIKQIFVISRAVVNPPICKEKRKKTKQENWCTKRHRKCYLSFSFSENNTLFVQQFFSSRASFSLLEWEKEKESLPESRLTFEVTKAQTSGLVNLVLSRQTGFIECEHPLIDKPNVITEPAVARTRMLGLGLKRYLSTLLPSVFVPLDQRSLLSSSQHAQ